MAEISIPLPTNAQMGLLLENTGRTRYDFDVDKFEIGMLALCAVDETDGTLWARFGADLKKSTNNGDTWTKTGTVLLGQQNSTNVYVDVLMVTPDGTMLATADPLGSDGGWIYRSTDDGVTWTEVYDWSVAQGLGSYILPQAWAVHPNYDGNGNHAIYVGEYTQNSNAEYTSNKMRVLRSIDDGATFQVIGQLDHLGSGARHWHYIIYDTFNNCLWLGTGDEPSHCKLYKITDGATLTYVNGGTYDWKFVSVVPYNGILYCPSDRVDAKALPCPAYIYDTRTGKLDILGYQGCQAWYSCINTKHRLPFWMDQVNQAVGVTSFVQGYTADYYGVYEVFRIASVWGTKSVASARPMAYGDYIYMMIYASVSNETVAFVRLKITERSAML